QNCGALGSNTSEDALLGSQNCGALGSNTSEDALLGLKNFGWASKTRHSETPQAGSESVISLSNKQTLMSTDDRLTRFGQPQRFALSQVQGDERSLESTTNATDTLSCHCERNGLCTNSGFTMAEVLITLGIIGVVAALTIPTLMQTQKEKSTIAAVKKNTSIVSNAVKMAIANDGEFSGTTAKDFYNYISPYLKIGKYCGTGTGCWTNTTIKTLDGSDWINMDSYNYEKAILADGSSLQVWANQIYGPEFRIDINGIKGPNQMGVDVFYFGVDRKDGTLFLNKDNGEENPSGGIYLCNKADSSSSYNGAMCANWILINDNMDYLHCDDLSWDGKTKCD
ncbi:type II secretion system protein, partial [bacterium]|nr:type II secretion system protein [bacterium]